jgi:hypothetical protein
LDDLQRTMAGTRYTVGLLLPLVNQVRTLHQNTPFSGDVIDAFCRILMHGGNKVSTCHTSFLKKQYYCLSRHMRMRRDGIPTSILHFCPSFMHRQLPSEQKTHDRPLLEFFI